MHENHTLTITQAAREIGVPPSTLRRWTGRGHVPFIKTLGGQRRFTRQQIREIQKPLLTANEAAIELGISASTLRRWSTRGLVPHVTTSTGRRRFTWDNVRLIRRQMSHETVQHPLYKVEPQAA